MNQVFLVRYDCVARAGDGRSLDDWTLFPPCFPGEDIIWQGMLQQYKGARIVKCPSVYFQHVKLNGGCKDLTPWAQRVVSSGEFLSQFKGYVPEDILKKVHRIARDGSTEINDALSESLYMIAWRDLMPDESLELYSMRLQGCLDIENRRLLRRRKKIDASYQFQVPSRDTVGEEMQQCNHFHMRKLNFCFNFQNFQDSENQRPHKGS